MQDNVVLVLVATEMRLSLQKTSCNSIKSPNEDEDVTFLTWFIIIIDDNRCLLDFGDFILHDQRDQ